jgi:hypothetical protein
MSNEIDIDRHGHPLMEGVTPVFLAGILVYGVAVMICGVLVDGTLAFAITAVALIAALAIVLGVGFFRALDDGDE